MKAWLLYPQKEWENTSRYFDEKAIAKDLGLNTLFLAAAKDIQWEDGKITLIREPDPYLEDTMKKVMLVPLETADEILYRQEILKDCMAEESFACRLYDLTSHILEEWNKLGRRSGAGTGNYNSPGSLMSEIYVLELFVSGLRQLKGLLEEYRDKLHSRGLTALHERLCTEFPAPLEKDLERILEDVIFYVDTREDLHYESGNEKRINRTRLVDKPRLVIGCVIGQGLKLEDFRLDQVGTDSVKRRRTGNILTRAQDYLNLRSKNIFSVRTDTVLPEQMKLLEFEAVRHIVSFSKPFVNAFSGFFDQLHLQAAFYRGAVNLRHFMNRFQIKCTFPVPKDRRTLHFRELQEVVMGLEQHLAPVGNTCDLDGKNLLLVTGANQGGKSTFLRSMGIAQVMMQCGLFVAAESFQSGIFPSLFTHFTRREDSAMNSGRLDEELGRMSQIIDHLKDHSMVLLNESFASTTEKEGSAIAYDIIRALAEADVKVLMVTHLISFAEKVWTQLQGSKFPTAFLSAQRIERQGRIQRTFKMIPHEPELTSFGLELYDEIILSQHTPGQ